MHQKTYFSESRDGTSGLASGDLWGGEYPSVEDPSLGMGGRGDGGDSDEWCPLLANRLLSNRDGLCDKGC